MTEKDKSPSARPPVRVADARNLRLAWHAPKFLIEKVARTNNQPGSGSDVPPTSHSLS